MKGINTWSFNPYHPTLHGNHAIYISRIAPGENNVTISWFPEIEYIGQCCVIYKKRGEPDENSKAIKTVLQSVEITGLDNECEYDIYVSCDIGRSRTRIFRTGFVPGMVVNYLHPEDESYKFSGNSLCSPSLLKLNDGTLLASMDVHEGGAPQNLTLIYKSCDGGQTWEHLTELFPCYWGKLFLHKGAVYMLAMSTEYGDILIGRSDDDGQSFCMPTVIMRGSCSNKSSGWHKAPMPIINHSGRIWTGVDYGPSQRGCASCLLSISENANFLDAENWMLTPPLYYDGTWEGTVKGNSRGCIEGNAVITPAGELVNILRYHTKDCEPSYGKAVVLKGNISEPEKSLEFLKVIDFEGNLSKFDIIYDAVSGKYISLITGTNETMRNLIENIPVSMRSAGVRNILSLAVSDDLFNWHTVCPLLDYSNLDPEKVGFQYISFLIDGNDIVYLSRTAFNNAENFHNANYSTFHKIENFRELLK
jgi:hypothetical protein